jgi:hypothetical protein
MIRLSTILEESKAGEEAKRLGLDYMSFGRYGKDGKVTHKSQGGKLVPVKAGSEKPTKSTKNKVQKTKIKKSTPSKNKAKKILPIRKLNAIAKAVDKKVDKAWASGKVLADESYSREEFLRLTGLTNAQFMKAVEYAEHYSPREHTFLYDKDDDDVWTTPRMADGSLD